MTEGHARYLWILGSFCVECSVQNESGVEVVGEVQNLHSNLVEVVVVVELGDHHHVQLEQIHCVEAGDVLQNEQMKKHV